MLLYSGINYLSLYSLHNHNIEESLKRNVWILIKPVLHAM